MRLLLDTHVLLWWLADDDGLSGAAAGAIADGDNEVVVSAATAWEISIKRGLGKLEAPDDVAGALAANDFRPLAIDIRHATLAGGLPPHHHDPFDRMLVAQAQSEGLTIVTGDARIGAYAVGVLAAS